MNTWRASSDEKENQEGIDGVIRFLADVHIRAGGVDNFDTGSYIPDMIVDLLLGIVVNVLMVDNASGQALTKGVLMYNKIEKVKEEENLKASLHEESQQILKDIIREAGKQ